jgi:ABC-type transport system involved in multi-copper enzyme maturation permease subunit
VIRGAVLERELLRAARRKNTYILRTAFAAGLLLLLGSFWIDRVEYAMSYDRGRLAGIGQELFQGYMWLQFCVLGIITPILVAQSVIEERDEKTIELLAITHLSPEGILWGKLLSCILGMGSLVLAGTPVLALCLSLGGVEALDVLNMLLQTATLVLSCAAMATFLGLFANGPVVPAFLTWMWLFACWGPGSVPMAAAWRGGDNGFAFFNPAFSLAEPHGWMIGAALVGYLPVCVGIVRVGAAAFGSMASGADDEDGGYGALSTSVWRLETIKRRTLALGIALATGMIAIPITNGILGLFRSFDWVEKILWWLWSLGFVWVGTVSYMFAARWALLRQRRPARKKVSWRRMAKEFHADDVEEAKFQATATEAVRSEEADAWGALLDTGPGLSPVRGPDPDRLGSEPMPSIPGLGARRNLSGHAADIAGATRRRLRRRWFLREIQGNPVFWRETVTRAHGALTTVLFRGYFLLVAMLLLMFLAGAFEDEFTGPILMLVIAGWCSAGAILATVLLTSSSIAGDRRAGTLALLCTTKMGPRGILFGKLQAVAAFAGPAFLIAAIMALPGMNVFLDRAWGDWDTAALLWKWALLVGWGATALVFLALSCQSIALRAKTPGRIWMLNLLWTTALVVGPGILLAVGEGNDLWEGVVVVLNPLMHQGFFEEVAPSPLFFASIAMWGTLSALVFRDNARRVGSSS